MSSHANFDPHPRPPAFLGFAALHQQALRNFQAHEGHPDQNLRASEYAAVLHYAALAAFEASLPRDVLEERLAVINAGRGETDTQLDDGSSHWLEAA